MVDSPIVARLRTAGCVFAEDEAAVLEAAAGSSAELDAMVRRRVEGAPLEVVVGWAEFCGLRILVDPGVFVPRHRTELLVREAVALARPGAVVLDLCCGTGAIGLAVADSVDGADVWASDLEPAAVRCARRNLPADRVFQGDLFAPVPVALRGRVDLLLANTPYVPTAEIAFLPSEARDHEPLVSLDGGSDGLDLQRRVAAAARGWLAPGGHLLVEATSRQAAVTVGIFEGAGLRARIAEDEDLGATVVIGTRPA